MEIPDLVRQRALSNGEPGRRWIAELPDVVAALAARWELTLGAPYPGGTAAVVLAAEDASGTPCVLKIAQPLHQDDVASFQHSLTAHRLAAGRGCATLLAEDRSASAMLLERLGPNLAALGYGVPHILDAVADTLREFWRPIPEDSGLPTGAEKAAWLADFIVTTWEQLDHPCPRRVIDLATEYCDRRAAAFDPRRAVLVHGDAHGWNTLQAGERGFKFVDPEGVWSVPEHDLAVPMREYNEPLLAGDTARLARERAAHLAERCGVDADAVWEWGFVERVSTGLANLRDFDDRSGDAFLAVAERCL
jgi:streptomycin 6-kinase